MTLATSPILLLVLLFLGLVLLVEGLWFWWRDVEGPRRRAAARVRRLAGAATGEAVAAQLQRRQQQQVGLFAGVQASLARKLGQAGWGITPGRLVLMMATGFVLLLVLLPALLGFVDRLGSPAVLLLVAAAALALAVGLPLLILDRRAARRLKLLEQQFPLALDIFVRGLRAGHPVSRSMELLVSEMPDPIASEFAQVIAEVNYGFDLRDALDNLGERVQTPDIQMFVVSVAVQSETGGSLAEILDGLSRVIRDRQSMKLKVRALASEGKMTAVVLTVLPVFTFVSVFLTSPNFFLDVADDPWFLPGVLIILGLYLTGVFMIRRMIDLKV